MSNQILIDASQRSGTFVLPNPSTIDGHLLIFRDIAGTLSAHSTLSIVAQGHVVATMSLPSSFLTLMAAPIGDKQYHVLGGNYLEWIDSADVQATISTTTFTTLSQIQSSDQTSFTGYAILSTLSTGATEVTSLFSPPLTASNGLLYFDGLPLQRGKVLATQEIQALPPSLPYSLVSSSFQYPLVWFDGKDASTMFTASGTHPSPGDAVVRWFAKPSTSFAYVTDPAQAPIYTGAGLFFPATSLGYSISNTDPTYMGPKNGVQLDTSYTIYMVTSPSQVSSWMFGQPGYSLGILNNWGYTNITSNGTNLSTPVATANMQWVQPNEQLPFCFSQPFGCNVYTVNRNTVNPFLQLSFNGTPVYTGRPRTVGASLITNLGNTTQGVGYCCTGVFGDLLFFNTVNHAPWQQLELETWLKQRWGLSS